jgi:uncharacterized membrane protein
LGRGFLVTASLTSLRTSQWPTTLERSVPEDIMATENHIRNPVEWSADLLIDATRVVGQIGQALRLPEESLSAPLPAVRKIDLSDIRDAVAEGFSDLGAYRTDALFLAVIYPLAGVVLAAVALNYNMIPLVFPLASGFALIGPAAALGLYELSRRREQGIDKAAADSFGATHGPVLGAIVLVSLLLFAIFLLWIAAAYAIYLLTLGPEPPTSIDAFLRDVFTTGSGWAMIVIGVGVGFLFAVLALTIGVISFPLMLDRHVGPYTAVATSVRAVAANPGPMAVWGMIVAGGLVIGSIPALIGLVIVMPLLGHSTWHLYRKVVPR